MIVDNEELKEVEVLYTFARSPFPMEYETRSRKQGGARLNYKRGMSEEIPIDVKFIREDSSVSWEDVLSKVAGVLLGKEEKKISFKHDSEKYFLAHVMSIEIEEEYEYAATGYITIFSEHPCMFGDEITLSATDEEQSFKIQGQQDTSWTSRTVMQEDSDKYSIKSSDQFLDIFFDFVRGDVIEIDYNTRRITLNGKNIDVGLSLESDWFILSPGYVNLVCSDTTDIIYTPRYY